MSTLIEFDGVCKYYQMGDTLVKAADLSLIHISEPTRRTPISYAVFCLKKKRNRPVYYTHLLAY